ITGRMGPESAARRSKLQRNLAQATMWAKGFAADETDSAFKHALLLAPQSETPELDLRSAHGQFLRHLTRGEVRAAKQVAEQFLAGAEASGRSSDVLVGRRLLGLIHINEGKFCEARDLLSAYFTG